jgi:dipeptidyl aminopeptidase/acylaminoacyl peptidase
MKKTPLVPTDLFRLTLPSDPQCAPDGSAFFVVSTHHEEGDEVRTAIWRARAGAPAAPFTAGTKDRAPRVSPDGTSLAFVADRGEGKKMYLMPLAGGEARALTPAYDALGALVWSPDARRLAYVATADHEPGTARIFHDEKSGARHIRKLPFKSDDEGLLDGRRKHLFVCDLAGGEPQQLTRGDFDCGGPSWSPDGATIAFAAQIDEREDSFLSDIFVMPAESGAKPVKLTAGDGPKQLPSFSHDGREIAFIGHCRGDDLGGRFNNELLVASASGGPTRSLSAVVDRPVTDFVICDVRGVYAQQAPVWSGGDVEILVPLCSDGTCGIAAFARDGSGHRVIVGGERDVNAFSRASDGTIAFVYSEPLVPSEIGAVDPFGNEERLTDCNSWLAERTIRAPRRFRPKTSDGAILDLFVLDPDRAHNAPYVLQVHGGPHMAYGFAFYFEFQMLAAHGIGVAYGNPRGSQSYGHAYADAITGDWGGIDASDVLTLLDAAEAESSIDRARVGVAGGSYGGFMTTWLLGHSKRFAAGISMRAVNDFVSEVGASDLGWFLEREVGAPWDDGGRKLFESSPMRSAHEIDVPLLVEHSERDYRCPVDQGEQLFSLLRRLGRQTEFVRFTGDGHNLSRTGKPRNRLLRLRAIAHWLIRHLRPDGVEVVRDEAGALFKPLPTEAS